jgi:hypothetical protein
MARRKNTKRIDPRYFLNETTHRDLMIEQEMKISDLATRYGEIARDKHPVLMLGPQAFIRISDDGTQGRTHSLYFATDANMSNSQKVATHPGYDPVKLLSIGLETLRQKGTGAMGVEVPQTDTVKVVG